MGLICLLLAGLALLHDWRAPTEGTSIQPASRIRETESSSTVPLRADSARPKEAIESTASDVPLGQLRLAITDSDATVRLHAVAALADIDDNQAGKMLAAALHDPDTAVRREAVFVLSERRGESNRQALEQALLDPNGSVREAAIEAFVRIGGEEAARAVSALVHIGDASSRLQAVDALGGIGGDNATASLREALLDENSTVRESAAELLPTGIGRRCRSPSEADRWC